jgi:hypothetical protein
MNMLRYLLITMTLCCSIQCYAGEKDVATLGQTFTQNFYSGDTQVIWDKMAPPMRDALGSEKALQEFRQQVSQEIGTETSIISENVSTMQGFEVYLRHARFSKFDQPIVISWAFDDDFKIAGFYIRPQQLAAQPKAVK